MAPAMTMAAPRTNLSRGRRSMVRLLCGSTELPIRGSSAPSLCRSRISALRPNSRRTLSFDTVPSSPRPLGRPSPGQPRNLLDTGYVVFHSLVSQPCGLHGPELPSRNTLYIEEVRYALEMLSTLFSTKQKGATRLRMAPDFLPRPSPRAYADPSSDTSPKRG